MGNTGCLLVCDFEGEFSTCEVLSRVGFQIDQVLPDALKHVTVGDHELYVFSFRTDESMRKALHIVEKLKQGQLPTPILLVSGMSASPEFLNHQKSKWAADFYLAAPASENVLLDAVDRMVGCPVPASLKGRLQFIQEDKARQEEDEKAKAMIQELKKRIEELEGARTQSLDRALEAQRSFTKTKLQALLKGQELQHQTETEQLKVALSEMEARLLDRESKLMQLEAALEKDAAPKENAETSDKALQALRDFYQAKLKALESEKKELERELEAKK